MIRPAYGLAPLVPLNEASVVIVPLPRASSKTVPSFEAPPTDAVPYRLPLLSMFRPAYGLAPLVPLKEASVVIVWLPWASSKTVPLSWGPPLTVVPYRLPLLSMIRPAYGLAPLVPLNEASVVIVPLPWASSKTVPSFEAPPTDAVPYRLPLLSMIRPARGSAPTVWLKEASLVIVPLPWASSKTVPTVKLPPCVAVPYRLPLLSMTSAECGFIPLVPLNEASMVIAPLPWASSKTVP